MNPVDLGRNLSGRIDDGFDIQLLIYAPRLLDLDGDPSPEGNKHEYAFSSPGFVERFAADPA